METQWIFSSTFLPCADESIEFLVEEREQPMHGTFANGIFHSRWADSVERVAGAHHEATSERLCDNG